MFIDYTMILEWLIQVIPKLVHIHVPGFLYEAESEGPRNSIHTIKYEVISDSFVNAAMRSYTLDENERGG